MKRVKIKVGSRSLTDAQAVVEIDRPENLPELAEFLGESEDEVLNKAMRAVVIKMQDSFLRPAFVEGFSNGLRGQDLSDYVQAAEVEMNINAKGKGGRPRKPPTIVFAEGELPETLTREQAMELLAKKGLQVKVAK